MISEAWRGEGAVNHRHPDPGEAQTRPARRRYGKPVSLARTTEAILELIFGKDILDHGEPLIVRDEGVIQRMNADSYGYTRTVFPGPPHRVDDGVVIHRVGVQMLARVNPS